METKGTSGHFLDAPEAFQASAIHQGASRRIGSGQLRGSCRAVPTPARAMQVVPVSQLPNPAATNKLVRLSFCMTCMGRLEHIKQTLPFGLRHNPEADVEFVLVNYNSADGLHDWVRAHMAQELATGRLKYLQLTRPTHFHMAHAKNVAHRAAAGRILVNLDADNFATGDYVQCLRSRFDAGCELLTVDLRDPQTWGGGCGRIAITRDLFFRLQGYDEEMTGWGYEDEDLVQRARLAGACVEFLDHRMLKYIQHDDAIRLANYENSDRRKSQAANRARSQANLRSGRIAANQDRNWGQA